MVFRALSPCIRSFLQVHTASEPEEIHGGGQRHSVNECEDNVGQHLSDEGGSIKTIQTSPSSNRCCSFSREVLHGHDLRARMAY
jgi:hypothetical protein